MGISRFTRKLAPLTHPETDTPNEPTWNLIAVFWGIIIILGTALAISFGSNSIQALIH